MRPVLTENCDDIGAFRDAGWYHAPVFCTIPRIDRRSCSRGGQSGAPEAVLPGLSPGPRASPFPGCPRTITRKG